MLLYLLPAALTAQVGSLLSFTSGREHTILFLLRMICHIFKLNPRVQLRDEGLDPEAGNGRFSIVATMDCTTSGLTEPEPGAKMHVGQDKRENPRSASFPLVLERRLFSGKRWR